MEISKDIGKGVKITRYIPDSPLQSILNIGRTIETKRRIKKKLNIPLDKVGRRRKKQLVAKFERDMNTYLNSKKKKNEPKYR